MTFRPTGEGEGSEQLQDLFCKDQERRSSALL